MPSTHYEVYAERPSDQHLLLPAVADHQRQLGRIPEWVAADAGFCSRANEEGAEALGGGMFRFRIATRAARNGVDWRSRAGSNKRDDGGRGVIKRRHGLVRCRYHGLPGMKRWVGLGVIRG